MISSYYQVNSDGSRKYASTSVRFQQSVNVNFNQPYGELIHSDLISIITNLTTDGVLSHDPDGVYAVIFRGEYRFPSWLEGWCAYHSAFYSPQGDILKFSVVGDSSTAVNGAACQAISDGLR